MHKSVLKLRTNVLSTNPGFIDTFLPEFVLTLRTNLELPSNTNHKHPTVLKNDSQYLINVNSILEPVI